MNNLNRRAFLRRTALASGAMMALQAVLARGVEAKPKGGIIDGGYGPINPTPATNTGEVFLALPEGFQYNVLGRTGTVMSDGKPTPGRHDGMAAYEIGGKIRLVRNHEVTPATDSLRVIGDAARAYDTGAGGGTTTLVIDPATRLLERDWVSLSGTTTNCAGGLTPWGTWITCEERVQQPGGAYQKRHGYNFEVPAAADSLVAAVPLPAMGRFVHEAIAIDPETGIVYQTEDRGRSGFYRFIPNIPGQLHLGGRLQMLAIKDRPQYDTRTGQRVGKPLPVTWVDISNPDPGDPNSPLGAGLAVYAQGFNQGAATFARLEGAWYGDGAIFFNATSGGDLGLGQVWVYRPLGNSGGQLYLLFESESAEILEAPDNICVTPGGGLILCEDGDGGQFLRGLTQKGEIFDFAKNLINEDDASEFAGATFSPDGQTLFVNVQTPGLTYAIWGPWENGVL